MSQVSFLSVSNAGQRKAPGNCNTWEAQKQERGFSPKNPGRLDGSNYIVTDEWRGAEISQAKQRSGVLDRGNKVTDELKIRDEHV